MRWQLKRVRQNINNDSILRGLALGVPTVVYFTTPFCIPCKTQPQLALKRLQDTLDENVQIVQVDGTQHPDDAGHLG